MLCAQRLYLQNMPSQYLAKRIDAVNAPLKLMQSLSPSASRMKGGVSLLLTMNTMQTPSNDAHLTKAQFLKRQTDA